MRVQRRSRYARACVPLALALAAPHAAAAPARDEAAFPERPVRLLVGFAPGGGIDTTARAIAQPLSAALGQEVVVDNRIGDAGNVAASIVAKADADGHTLLMGTIAALAINPTLYGNLPFDPVRDFAPITRVVNSTNILVVHPQLKANDVKGLIALAKASPGKMRYGSSGTGSAGHLAGELFNSLAGVRMVHVPAKGGAAVIADLLAAEVPVAFAPAVTAIPHIRRDKIRALGVTTLERAGMLPEIPTIAEQGLKGYDANNWYGLLAPARTPRPIVQRLNAEVVKILKHPDVRRSLVELGLDPAPTTPEQFQAYMKSEIAKWAKIVRVAGALPN
jgi:tripartite-type tricarboxylate transporter receptor subunit TctC